MEVQVGLRVVRGPDWESGNQDGGEGYVGTVVEVESTTSDQSVGRSVVVQWDCGERSTYRCGLEGKYDLRVLDSAPTGVMHNGVICDSCGREDMLSGMRWECTRCCDYDLCSICYMAGKHNLEHEFFRYDKERIMRYYIPIRAGARRIRAKGIFPRANVVRGVDWEYGDEDGGGGNPGIVVILKNWKPGSYRSAVDVKWTSENTTSSKIMTCRVGHEGKVDLKYTTPSSAGFYYPDHLPILGAPYQPPGPTEYGYGDYVKIELDKWLQHQLQEGRAQAELMGLLPIIDQIGSIQSISDARIASVKYTGGNKIAVPTNVLAKVDVPIFIPKQAVRVIDDLAEVMKLQKDHGGWIDDMTNTIGRVGVVVGQQYSGNVVVSFDRRPFAFNPQCLTPAPEESVTFDPNLDFKREDKQLQAEMQTLFERDDPQALLQAAKLGDETITREFLNKFKNEVNRRFQDNQTALHHAAMAGHVPVIKVLLEYGADKDVTDDNEATPLHYCILNYKIEAAKALLEAGANPNLKDKLGRTALIIAASKGRTNAIELLLKYPSVDRDIQDSDGDTALHCAVSSNWHWSVHLLLEAGAKHDVKNNKEYMPLHVASGVGATGGVEEILKYFPQHINCKGSEGCTPLHLATLNNHSDVVGYLLMKNCEVDAKSLKGYTALHCSILAGALRIVEKLVRYGADVNAQDNDGDTPMHLLSTSAIEDKTVTQDLPGLMKVKDTLREGGQEDITTRSVLACYLVENGANMFTENKKGEMPLNRLPIDEVSLVATFCEQMREN